MARRSDQQPAEKAVDPALAAFASFVRKEEASEREAKQAARAERRKAEEAGRLVAAKDAAAAEVKRLRGLSGVSAEERAAADKAYRDALAAVVAAETGTTPAWAPASDDTAPPDEGTTDDAAALESIPAPESETAEGGFEEAPEAG